MNMSRWDAARRKHGIKPEYELSAIASAFEAHRRSVVGRLAKRFGLDAAQDAYQCAFLTFALASNDRKLMHIQIFGRAIQWLGYIFDGDRKHNRPGLERRRTARDNSRTVELLRLADQCLQFVGDEERPVLIGLVAGDEIGDVAKRLGKTKRQCWRLYARAARAIAEATDGCVALASPAALTTNRKRYPDEHIIALRDMQRLPFSAIGERLGMTKANAHTAYLRAKKKAGQRMPDQPAANVTSKPVDSHGNVLDGTGPHVSTE